MTGSRIPSRMLRDAARRHDETSDLDEFIGLLLDALAVDEVADAVRARLRIPPVRDTEPRRHR